MAPVNKDDSQERYISDTMRSGGQVNYPELVKVLAKHAVERALDLEKYGLAYAREGGELKAFPHPECDVPRALPGGAGYSGDWFRSLVNEIVRLNIPVMKNLVVTNLIKKRDTVVGAVGFNRETGILVTIVAKSIVLATGGAGHLYSFSTNVSGITGDGHVMAYRAGAALSHLEFMQMRQNIIYPEGLRGMLPPYDGFINDGGRFYNGLHERYMRRYHPEKLEKLNRAEITKCAQLEISAKRQSVHGGIYGDLSDVPQERIYSVESFIKACKTAGFDPTYQCYEWAPASHHFMGGIVINAACQGGVDGLYAAGEVAAGVHGANRMAGNALTETQVFGAIAGNNAAFQAKIRASIGPSSSFSKLEKERLIRLFNRNEGIDHKQIRTKITEILSNHVGVIRDEDGLKLAIDSLEEIRRNQIGHLYLSEERSFKALSELLEVENLLTLGQLVAQAALLRTESRGAHYRKDYPATSHEWEKNILFQLVGFDQTTKIVPIN